MPWIILVLAGLFEVGWAIGLKYTDGFTRLVPTLLTPAHLGVRPPSTVWPTGPHWRR